MVPTRSLRCIDVAAAGLAVVLTVGSATISVFAADHGDSPAVRENGTVDINDIYAFQSPTDSRNVAFIITTHPLAGILSPTVYRPNASYDLLIDNDGDARADIRFRFTFSHVSSKGKQQVQLSTRGIHDFTGSGTTGETIELPHGGKLTADRFDDPFFFDLIAFRDSLQFRNPGVNFFNGLEVLAIVLELPRSLLGADRVGVWSATRTTHQVDRMGRPAINTVLISSKNKDRFNRGRPRHDDRDFRDDVLDHLRALGNDTDRANMLVDFLLPDILTIDTSSRSGFPNGRRLEDDVIDIELNLLSNGAVPGDNVANDSAFRSTFPYLAPTSP